MYKVTFYSKYDFKSFISIDNISQKDVLQIQELFNNKKRQDVSGVLNQNVNTDSKSQTQIDLNNIVYIEYLKKEKPSS